MPFSANHSRNVLFRIALGCGLAAFLGVLALPDIISFYWREQLVVTGLILNGLIIVLFLVGLYRIVTVLLRYLREEVALARFAKAMRDDRDDPGYGIWPDSLIFQRFEQILRLSRYNRSIDHGALAATVTANEATRIGFPRFINGILILLGVFGTLFSLNLALLGASDLLSNFQNPGSMGMVIAAMSTALTTTVTAIVCYLFFGLFYMQLLDTQTRLISGLEEVTTLYLLPRYAPDTDTVLQDLATLARSLQQVAERIQTVQDHHLAGGYDSTDATATVMARFDSLDHDVARLHATLAKTLSPAVGEPR